MEEKNKWIMPAEWEEHKALWLAWPYDEITFPGRVEKAQAAFMQIIKAVHVAEPVNLLVLDEAAKDQVMSLLIAENIDPSRISFYMTDYADVWMRDYGPMFVADAQTGLKSWVKWGYNAYGNKFPDLLKDNDVFLSIHGAIDSPMIDARINMEGGAIEINGSGTLITTEQCLLNPNRNPELSKEQIEGYLRAYTGAQKIIWLKEGIVNDHTDGHIDDVAKFVDTNTIVCAYEDDPTDPNFVILDEAYRTLADATDQDGNPFTVIKLPMPHMSYDDGTKAPASYANFYIANGVVLVPIFNDPNDAKALEIIAGFFPGRTTIGIDCSDVIYGGGAIHCVTQQEPK